MATKLKTTDSLYQWSIKVNEVIEEINALSQSGGLFESVSPADGDFIVYDSGFKNKGLTGPIVFDSTYGATGPDVQLKLNPVVITGASGLVGDPDAADYVLIYDASTTELRKVSATALGGGGATVSGTATHVQYNLDGTSLAGSSGFTYTNSSQSVAIAGDLTVDTNTLHVDSTNNRVGIGTTTPSVPLDVVGNLNISTGSTFRIAGTQVLSSTALGSGVTSSSLTSLGTISTLSAGTGTFSGALTANSATITNGATIGTSLTVGTTLGVSGASTLASLSVTGAATVGTTLGVSGTLTGTTGTFSGTVTGNALVSTTSVTAASASISGAAAVGSLTVNSKSLSLSGNTTIGSSTHTVAFVTSGNTSVTLPTSGTLLSTSVTTLSSLTSVGILTNLQTTSLGVGTAASGTTGEIRATNNITAYYSSDARLKENVTPIPNALEKINKISGVNFDWSDEFIKRMGGEDDFFVRKHDVGVIAQEIQEVLPEVVATREDGYLAVKYDRIIPLLIEAIKELQAKVEKLEGK